MKKLIALLIILAAVLAALAAAIVIISSSGREEEAISTAADETETRENRPVFSDEEINVIEELISAKADGRDTEEFMKKLEKISPKERAAWDEILAFWDETREEGFVNTIESGGHAISQMEGCPVTDTHEGTLLPDGLPKDDSLCIVCLGFQLYPDGRMRDELVGRLEVARACAMKYPDAWILLTGGPTAAQDKTITEADAMADWLVENGIEKDRILIENRSLTSAANALYSYELLNEGYPQVTDIAIVTSDYHIALGSQLFQAQFTMARARGSSTGLNVVANASYHVDINEAFSKDSEAKWLRILVREQAAGMHDMED